MRRLALVAALGLWFAPPAPARAAVDIVIEASGSGFADATPVAARGGNRATTLGAQRLATVRFAADIWGKLLDSPVPIVVRVRFASLGCGDDSELVLAQTGTPRLLRGLTGQTDTQVWYPPALANRIAGVDLNPGQPDIVMEINSDVDEACQASIGGWYYGLDGGTHEGRDLVDTLIHELAHGLGFSSMVDEESGALLTDGIDAFSAHIVDLRSGQSWSELDAAARARSIVSPRSIVFNGEETRRAVARILTAGSPTLRFEPSLPEFSGWVGDGGLGLPLTAAGVSGPVVLLPAGGSCTPPMGVGGSIVLLAPRGERGCTIYQFMQQLRHAGAQGVLLAMPESAGEAPRSVPEPPGPPLGIPVLTLASNDALRLTRMLGRQPVRAHLTAEPSQRAGADAMGRPFLYTNRPVSPGSSISHFDTLARPDLLMEPFARAKATHAIDLTRAVLTDIGWTVTCGNGKLDPGEDCDDGAKNADSAAATCLTTCKRAACGDGVVSGEEQCDDGPENSDSTPNACRTSCRRAHCGDLVVDRSELCDGTADCSGTCDVQPSVAATGIKAWEKDAGSSADAQRAHKSGGCSLGAPTSADNLPSWLLVGVLTTLPVARGRRRRAA